MKKLLTISLLLLGFLTSLNAENLPLKQPTMTLTDIQGKTYQITGTENGLDIKGTQDKIVFLEFFGHKCPPCLASIPHLITLQEKYKDTLSIIAIEVQGLNNDQLKAFAQQKGMNYTVISNEKAGNFVNYIAQRAQWRGAIPFMVALDQKGNVQFMQAGMLPEAALEELIRQLSTIDSKKINHTKEINSTKETNNTK